jgi:hypothetical protein
MNNSASSEFVPDPTSFVPEADQRALAVSSEHKHWCATNGECDDDPCDCAQKWTVKADAKGYAVVRYPDTSDTLIDGLTFEKAYEIAGKLYSEPPKEDSGVGLTRSGEAVEAERRQDQAEPCNTALPSTPKEERGEWTAAQIAHYFCGQILDTHGCLTLAHDITAAIKDEREKREQAERVAQVCYDLHAALGVKWGDDPYSVISNMRQQLLAALAAIEKHNKELKHGGCDDYIALRFGICQTQVRNIKKRKWWKHIP